MAARESRRRGLLIAVALAVCMVGGSTAATQRKPKPPRCAGGYFVGKAIPNVEVFFTGLVILMVGLSVLPAAIHLLRERRAGRRGQSETGV